MSVESHTWHNTIQIAALSDVGMRRSNNQDHYGVVLSANWDEWRKRGHLFVVADGMGAHAAGELASEIAVDRVGHLYRKYVEKTPPDALVAAVEEANAVINRKGEENSAFHKMGTTCSSLLILPQGAIVAQVGDSRVYRLRGDKLEQLSFDHSMAWEIRAATQGLDAADVYDAIPKNVITRSLGPGPTVEVDLEGPFPLQVGDTFFVCSDGATGPLRNDEIAIILKTLDPSHAVQLMVDLANLRGGPDNITVIVAKITGEAITQDPTRTEPLIMEEARPANPPPRQKLRNPPWTIWALLLLFGFATAALVYLDRPFEALISGLAAFAAFVFGAVYMYSAPPTDEEPIKATPKRRLGRGPYEETFCNTTENVARNLAATVVELREASETNHWKLDWDRVNQLRSQAQLELAAGDYFNATRLFLICIGAMMAQIRMQSKKKNPLEDESKVDLI
ncbi:PP2C family protein-serine/threonine phosphatase [Blastopirellula marina]|uniref:Probable protein phosphatase 1 n=1 Tax=Blastopirellula marina DSM 3645 TaxID=314230 RepID=A3ZYP0_9BACT|nr:protein phosphatase 2C domain-containing protein [Blastopirellula marina]EAQ78260.1 probable protein phosphatase 1 [Blastopirellula marina DSM 3645]